MTVRKMSKSVIAVILSILCVFCFMPAVPQQAQAAVKPGKVSSIKVKRSGKTTTISWKKGRNAKKYRIYYQSGTGSRKKTLYDYTKKTTIKERTKYKITWISIISVNGAKKSSAKTWGEENETPELHDDYWGNYTSVSAKHNDKVLKLSWSKMLYATKYKVTFQQGYSSNSSKVIKVTTNRKITLDYNAKGSNYIQITIQGIRGNTTSTPMIYIDYGIPGAYEWEDEPEEYEEIFDGKKPSIETKDAKTYIKAYNRIKDVIKGQVDERNAYSYVSNNIDKDIIENVLTELNEETITGNIITDWCYKIIQEDLSVPEEVTADWCYDAATEWTYLQETCGYEYDTIDHAFAKYIYDDIGVKGVWARNYKGELKYYEGMFSIYYHTPSDYNGPVPWSESNTVFFS